MQGTASSTYIYSEEYMQHLHDGRRACRKAQRRNGTCRSTSSVRQALRCSRRHATHYLRAAALHAAVVVRALLRASTSTYRRVLSISARGGQESARRPVQARLVLRAGGAPRLEALRSGLAVRCAEVAASGLSSVRWRAADEQPVRSARPMTAVLLGHVRSV